MTSPSREHGLPEVSSADPALSCSALSASYTSGEPVVRDVNLALAAGTFTAIVGPNGSGKSTLLSCLARQLPHSGTVSLNGRDASTLARRTFARELAFLPQAPTAPEGVTVRGLVERGRNPYRTMFAPLSRDDHAAIDAALTKLDLIEYQHRPLSELSGGQRQRAWIALVVAQDAPILLLDEPTAFLDLSHQVSLLDLAKALAREGRTVLCVLHDLNLAFAFADDVVVLESGTVRGHGAPASVITRDLLAEVFDLHADVIGDPVTGSPVILPRPTDATKQPRQHASEGSAP